MPEINLLPDEMRRKEKKEINSTNNKSDNIDIAMSNPEKEIKDNPSRAKSSGPSVLSRLFAQKASSAPVVRKRSDKYIRANEPMHIPQENVVAEEKKVPQKKDTPNIVDDNQDATEDVIEDVSKKKKEKGDKKKFKFNISTLVNFVKKRSKDSKDLISDALDVNLIPEDLIKYPEVELPKIYARSGGIIFITILIVLGGYLGITFYQINLSRQIANIESSMTSLDEQINSFDSDKKSALRLQKRISLVKELLEQHIYWTDFLTLLENHTIKDVYYTNFSMAGHDKLIISAIAKDYSAVAQQLVAFEDANDFIQSVKIEAAAAEIDQENDRLLGVSFSATLEFIPGVFVKSTN